MRKRICWRNKLTGVTGNGEYREGLTEKDIKKLNRRVPDLEHWLENEPEPPKQKD